MDGRLISSLAPAVTQICTTALEHRSQKKAAQRKAELEKELIEKKAEARDRHRNNLQQRQQQAGGQPERTGSAQAPPANAPPTGGDQFSQDLDAIRQGPDCGFCSELLSELVHEPPERKRQGVSELAELKRAMQRNPDQGDIQALMDGFEVIPELALEV